MCALSLDVSRYLLVSFAAQSLCGHIITQLIVKEYHAPRAQKGKAEMRRVGFQYLFQDRVLHDGLETSHQGPPRQCPTASLGHHAENGASNADAEGMKIPAITIRFPASEMPNLAVEGTQLPHLQSLCNTRAEGEAKRTGRRRNQESHMEIFFICLSPNKLMNSFQISLLSLESKSQNRSSIHESPSVC